MNDTTAEQNLQVLFQLARALINMQRTIILNIVIDLPHPVALSLRPWNIRTTELHYRGHSRTNINTLPSP